MKSFSTHCCQQHRAATFCLTNTRDSDSVLVRDLRPNEDAVQPTAGGAHRVFTSDASTELRASGSCPSASSSGSRGSTSARGDHTTSSCFASGSRSQLHHLPALSCTEVDPRGVLAQCENPLYGGDSLHSWSLVLCLLTLLRHQLHECKSLLRQLQQVRWRLQQRLVSPAK